MNSASEGARQRKFWRFTLLAENRTGLPRESCVTRTVITGSNQIRSGPRRARSTTCCADCQLECRDAPCCFTRPLTRSSEKMASNGALFTRREKHEQQRHAHISE